MYDQHTTGMTTTRHRSLVEGGERKVVVREIALHTTKKKIQKNRGLKSKKRFSGHTASIKAIRLFLKK